MRSLTETSRITILMMIGYANISKTQTVVKFFRENYTELLLISQGTVSKFEKQFRVLGHVNYLPRRGILSLKKIQNLVHYWTMFYDLCMGTAPNDNLSHTMITIKKLDIIANTYIVFRWIHLNPPSTCQPSDL